MKAEETNSIRTPMSIAVTPENKDKEKYDNLLRDYAAISSRRSGALEASALRHRASSYRDILAYQATGNTLDYMALKSQLESNDLKRSDITSIFRFAELGRLILLQDLHEDDTRVGQVILHLVVEWLSAGKSKAFRKLLIQSYILTGAHFKAEELIEAVPEIDEGSHQHLQTDLINPFVSSNEMLMNKWLSKFNRPFARFNLLPISLAATGGVPFNRLTTEGAAECLPVYPSQKQVSVIFTSFQPKRDDIYAAVQSVISQTWKNLEIIIVNDSSGPAYDSVFEEISKLDNRIKIVTTPRNSGTYIARNLGFGMAQGDFVTGHDDDDWSHPQRIEVQLAFMETNPEAAGCRVHAIACSEDLVLSRLGKATPEERNASTLMLRRDVWNRVGGFLAVRKAGDTELFLRVERITKQKVQDIQIPLTIIRKAKGSLSNAEFRTGWSHPARRSFKAQYNHWHNTATDHELSLQNDAVPKLGIPYRFQINQNVQGFCFDVIFAGDWHPHGGPQRSMLEEIRALIQAGKRIGIMHLEPARFMSSKERPLNVQILELINSGQVTNVLYDDPAHTDLLILRYPPIMQFPPTESSGVLAKKVMILANQAPEELDGSDVRYIPRQVHENTVRAFGTEVAWVPQSAMVRDRLVGRLDNGVIEPFDMPGILNLDEWYVQRKRFRSTLPVVGRHSRDDAMKWPERASDLRSAYPTDGTFDVRILGGAKTPLSILKRTAVPGGWTVYAKDQISPQRFLATVDFYVFFQNSKAVEAFGRSILEAVAAGVIVILPQKFEPVFGEAAIYSKPGEVKNVIHSFFDDRERYQAQVETSRRFVEKNFSYNSYLARIESILKDIHATIV